MKATDRSLSGIAVQEKMSLKSYCSPHQVSQIQATGDIDRPGAERKNHVGRQNQPFQPLVQIQALFDQHDTNLSRGAFREAIFYLAKSWSQQGHGFFAPSDIQNLEIALDLAIAQTLLPRVVTASKGSPKFYEKIAKSLDERYQRSLRFLNSSAVGYK